MYMSMAAFVVISYPSVVTFYQLHTMYKTEFADNFIFQCRLSEIDINSLVS